jgi:hypothetical protein
MTKTVADAAIMLGAMEGAVPDPHDAATRTCTPPPNRDYTKFLNASGLKGKRIGVPRAFYIDRVTLPGESDPRGGINAEQGKAMADAIAVLRQQGAVIVDPAEIPSFVAKTANDSFPLFDYCSGAEHAKGKDSTCSAPFKYGMKRDFNAWLASLGPSAPVKSLTELRNWNLAHAKANAIKYQQSRLDISDEMDLAADKARYEADRAKDLRLSREQGIDAALAANKLDAISSYVTSLDKVSRSPFRSVDGTLTVLGAQGEAIFKSRDCQKCHKGRNFTDSTVGTVVAANPFAPAAGEIVLHDVGTIKPTSGTRLGGGPGSLVGIDTPTLKGLWQTAPYLHDGSAATLAAAS